MNTARLRGGQLLRLSLSDLWHERWLALCTACVLAATLTPLWTLWGLERGVMGTLIERMDRDPLMRRIVPETTGSGRFDAQWIARVAQWPEVSFVVPTVRATAALVEVFGDTASQVVELQATGPGDPLLAGVTPPHDNGIVISADVAERLQVVRGKPLRIALSRQRDGRTEPVAIAVSVTDVIPADRSDGKEGFVAPALLDDIESWRDGHTIAAFGPDGYGPPPPKTVHPLFRMHAASIRDVQALVDRLAAEGISTRTHARELEASLGMQRNLRTVLAMIAAITIVGAVVAMAALQIATVRRKRREYALLKLTGHGRAWLIAMACANAAAVALVGGAIALVLYTLGAFAINAHFADHLGATEAAVRLDAVDFTVGLLGALVISVLPALWGGWRASNVEAADELRDL